MRSEKRLHPASFVFRLASQLKALVVPLGFLLVGAGSGDVEWQLWALLVSAPYGLLALAQSLAFRYRFDDRELVIRSGLIFRNVRHIPYARIQNIDAVQNVLHRLLHVAEVRIETGGGSEVEARMQVLPLTAFEEMRTLVFAHLRPAVQASGTEGIAGQSADAPRGDVLLRLPASELILNGLIQNRGAIVVGAMFGLAVELGMMDRLMDRVFGDTDSDRGVLRQLLRSLAGQAVPPVGQLLMAFGVLVLLLVVLRVLSVVWTVTRLYGFTLTRIGEDLRTEFGLLTRVAATIPLRRIQTLTIHENPLHRLCGRVSIAVDTAGAAPEEADGRFGGESIAPILRTGDVPAFLQEILPGIDIGSVDWQAPHPRAFRRTFAKGLIWSTLVSAAFVLMAKWWTLVLLATLGATAFWHARLTVKHLRWGMTADAVLLRRGWLWRSMSLARVTKIQAIALHESPFDRRHRMASVAVDTAGGGIQSRRVAIPYLGRQTADVLAEALTAKAARTAFRW
jgi:putative membrane protein